MAIKIVDIDIVKAINLGLADVVIHGCHCFCLMEHGIAKVLGDFSPELKKADLNTKKGDANKLGTYSHAVVPINGEPLVLINGYTQFNYGKPHYRNSDGFNYDSFEMLLKRIIGRLGSKRKPEAKPLVFLMPFIGADRGNADPDLIIGILEKHFEGEMLLVCVRRELDRRVKHKIVKYFDASISEVDILNLINSDDSKEDNFAKITKSS